MVRVALLFVAAALVAGCASTGYVKQRKVVRAENLNAAVAAVEFGLVGDRCIVAMRLENGESLELPVKPHVCKDSREIIAVKQLAASRAEAAAKATKGEVK